MTYDERQEIDQYLDIIEKNAERLIRSVNMLRDTVDRKECVIKEYEKVESAKEKFLKQY
jgi:cell division septum initiation protein DivIVA